MTITLNTTKGNPTFRTLAAACEWLESYQPSAVSMTVNGRDVDYEFDAVPEFDADTLKNELAAPLADAVARGDIGEDDTLTPQELDGKWTVVDSSGQRFWPSETATTAGAALEAVESGAGEWHN